MKIEPEKAAAVCGTVRDRSGAAVEGALVLLFRSGQEKKLLDRQFTDEEGQFSFGPIEGNVLYLIKVYKNSVKLRDSRSSPTERLHILEKTAAARRQTPRRLTFIPVF